jgi:tetratricopeptide (TPR) repeat protein
MRSFRRGLGAAVLMVLVAAGAAGLLAARWTAPVAEGDAAVAARDWPRAYAAYGRAADRFDRLPAVRQFFARDYARAIAAQLWIDYNGERYDDVIERAQRAPDAASPHFWAGLAYFAKGRSETKSEAQLALLGRAEEEMRRAVEADPLDLDTKYNYELVSRLAAGLRKAPKVPPNQLMQLLRQQPKTSAKPTRRVG